MQVSFLEKKQARKRGTPGWWTPEQFTRRWDYCDYNGQGEEPICGNYDSHMNVWAVGAIMWCLALLAKDISPVHDGYRSSMDYALGDGSTYGKAIEKTNYSHQLKLLILKCLMENPKNRPDEQELLYETAEGKEDSANLEETDNDWDFEIDLGNSAIPIVPGVFEERNAAPPPAPASALFPNFSNNAGAAGVVIRGVPGAEDLEANSPVKGAVDGSRRISLSGRSKRKRSASVGSQQAQPAQRQRRDSPERAGGNEEDPSAQENIEMPKFRFEHVAFPEVGSRRGEQHSIKSRWRGLFDVSGANKTTRDPAIFTWTPPMIEEYSQKYVNRARLCGDTDGIKAANDRPEDMARLQLDWENQRHLARQQAGIAQQTVDQERVQMQIDREQAGEERVRRLENARNDASQAVGHTPAAMQSEGAPVEANLPRPASYP